ncbi:Uncharacterised protein [uncultured Clostridium sp.]|jgi:hypothetical protein|nr:Uncharacterised protein [uncultured Clostridium sp.]
MTDFLLAVVIIIFGVLGFFLMKRVDRFLENSRKEQVKLLESSERYLRIGTANPYVIDACAEAFEKCEKKFPNSEVQFYSGIEEKLIEALMAHKLDLVFLPENSVVKMDTDCRSKAIELSCASTIMSEASVTVELVGEKKSRLKAFWERDHKEQVIVEFLKCLDEISHYI